MLTPPYYAGLDGYEPFCCFGRIVKPDNGVADEPCPLRAEVKVALHKDSDMPSGMTVTLTFCLVHADLLEEEGAGFIVE